MVTFSSYTVIIFHRPIPTASPRQHPVPSKLYLQEHLLGIPANGTLQLHLPANLSVAPVNDTFTWHMPVTHSNELSNDTYQWHHLMTVFEWHSNDAFQLFLKKALTFNTCLWCMDTTPSTPACDVWVWHLSVAYSGPLQNITFQFRSNNTLINSPN